jgi:hypothetical protein
MKVGIYAGPDKLATATVDRDGMLSNVIPHEGRGLAYGRYLQITAIDGRHTGSTITALVMGDTGNRAVLKEPFPFKE